MQILMELFKFKKCTVEIDIDMVLLCIYIYFSTGHCVSYEVERLFILTCQRGMQTLIIILIVL